MSTILTPTKAAIFLRSSATDTLLLELLPLVDEYLYNATGHDWAQDATLHPSAITAAGMLLLYWYDNPTLIGQAPLTLRQTLVQLEAEALKFRQYGFLGRVGAGGIAIVGLQQGDQVIRLIGTYGVSGSQAAQFESTVSQDDQLQQTGVGDLSANQYVVVVKHPAADVRS
jgi:hypothetical protein